MIPASKTGKSMIRDAGLLVYDLKIIPSPKKRSIRINPPILSDFQAIISAASSMKVGML